MSDVAFDAITRRASLLGLSAAGLASLAMPAIGSAKKKKHKKKKFDVNTFCKQQVDQCETAITTACTQGPDPDPDCLEKSLPCCKPLATCDFSGFVVCLQAAQED